MAIVAKTANVNNGKGLGHFYQWQRFGKVGKVGNLLASQKNHNVLKYRIL